MQVLELQQTFPELCTCDDPDACFAKIVRHIEHNLQMPDVIPALLTQWHS